MPDEALPVAPTKKSSDPRTTYTIPDSARARPKDPKTLTYVLLTIDMEIDADKASAAAGGGEKNVRRELIKRAVVAVDGRAVSWEGSDPEWFDDASPKVRELAWYGFVKVNRTTNDEDKAFLDSEDVGTG
jgi:hypothetical protein